MRFDTDIFAQFDRKWALLSAGIKEAALALAPDAETEFAIF